MSHIFHNNSTDIRHPSKSEIMPEMSNVRLQVRLTAQTCSIRLPKTLRYILIVARTFFRFFSVTMNSIRYDPAGIKDGRSNVSVEIFFTLIA